MIGRHLACAACAFFLVVFIASAETLPSGTTLELRLQQPLSSYATEKGTRLTAVLIAPVSDSGKVLLPLGTTLEGTVIGVRKVGLGVAHETAQITLDFDRLVLANGQAIAIHTHVTQVENARESVDREGRIHGIRSTATLSHRTSGIVGTLALGDPIAAMFTTAASAGVLRFSEPEISLPAGTELFAELDAPIDIPGEKHEVIPPVAATGAEKDALGHLVHDLPYRTYTEGSNIPSDITNLVFIGSAGALQRAFTAAGWVPVDSLTVETTYRTVRSIAENQGYNAAPMSTLLLDNKQPGLAYSKTLNTFAKRHHLRIWKTAQSWNGQTVWTSSATHDIGIGFSRSNKTFIHLIDSRIDNERAKVVNDLIFTGCVSNVQLVSRPWIPPDATNGTGEKLITDGRIAILELSDCRQPDNEARGESTRTLPIHGNAASRGTRQIVLTLKNQILRDNIIVMGYSGIHYLAAKKSDTPRPVREMDIEGNRYTIEADSSPGAVAATGPPPPANTAPRTRPPRVTLWTPPSVEFGINGGWLGYFGGNGGAVGYLVQSTVPPDQFFLLVLGNGLDNGWNIGGTVTLDSYKYFSHEFGFNYSFTTFDIGLAVIFNDETSPDIQSQFAFSSSGLGTSQFTYNLLYNFTPKTARLRPYLAIGPALQLMHLDDAPIKKAPGWFKLGLSNIGLISAAYNFGSTPPLEGGGIFQPGLNYGGGIRYRITPRWMIRTDFRETLTSQPDFWSKSKDDILAGIYVTDATVTVLGPKLNGALRQDKITGGLSFTF